MSKHDISEGARIIIQRMKDNPEDFEWPDGRFCDVKRLAIERLHGLNGVNGRNYYKLSERDARAIMDAVEEVLEAQFTEQVVKASFDPEDITFVDLDSKARRATEHLRNLQIQALQNQMFNGGGGSGGGTLLGSGGGVGNGVISGGFLAPSSPAASPSNTSPKDKLFNALKL